ncbi:hypothetical protein JOD02_001513 [Caldicoprobacter guelmensis]|uniref:restriction endonuclease n=1 Tax=Caldicoprobacter guelmensis TaxID=1170224 RepID=UPI00195D6B63|nr:restriction endonuclease [Caldicoprobacter guelmensis]MBM7582656.1 hypothetical protein [Caldicoprobacter guelmensis]
MNSLKRLFSKISEWNYYIEGDKPASILSWVVDAIILSILTLCMSYLWFVYQSKIPWLSLIFALMATATVNIVYLQWRAGQFKRKKQAKLNKIAAAHRIKSLMQLTPTQFKWQLAKALLHSGKFEDIKVGKKFLKAKYDGRQALISFYHTPYSQQVPPFEIYKFLNVLKHSGYTTGFYFTLSSFSNTCNAILQDHDDIELHLIDGNNLIKIMEKAGIFNDSDAIKLHLRDEIEKSKIKKKQARKNLFTPAKAKTYIFYGFLFLAVSFLFRTYFIYYIILSVSFVLLGILVYIANPGTKETKSQDEVLND